MNSDWSPEPATLRETETPDDNAHARGNIEQLRRVEDDDGLPDELRERAGERADELERES